MERWGDSAGKCCSNRCRPRYYNGNPSDIATTESERDSVSQEGAIMSDEQAIRDLIDRWLAATEAGNTETVLTMVADDVIFLGAGTPTMNGKAEFAQVQAGMKGVKIEATADTQEIRVLG